MDKLITAITCHYYQFFLELLYIIDWDTSGGL